MKDDLQQIVVIHLCWISLHYASAHLYAKYCTPWSVLGVAISPVMAMAPHCQAMRWCIVQGASSINSMWVTLGTYLLAKAAAYNIHIVKGAVVSSRRATGDAEEREAHRD